jgi:hypothetical protein
MLKWLLGLLKLVLRIESLDTVRQVDSTSPVIQAERGLAGQIEVLVENLL